MKSKIKWILLAAGLVVVIAGAAVLYRVLSANYSGENLMQSAQTQEQSAQESEFAAPDFTVYDGDGNEVHLSDYKGKPVVLNFWATWCPPCVGELPHIEKKYAEYKDKMHFVILSVDDNEQDPARFIQSKGYTFPAAYGDHQALGRAYGIDAIPASYIISADGHIVARIVGSMNESSLDAFLQKAF